MKKVFIRIAETVQDALFPNQCLVCGSFFHFSGQKCNKDLLKKFLLNENKEKIFQNLMAPFLCGVCLSTYSPIESPVCGKCGIMFKSREGNDHFCEECLKSPRRFGTVRAAGIYDKAFMTLIHVFKYRGKTCLARPLGALLFITFKKCFENRNIDLIMPVPLHARRLRDRGFNQVFLLIRELEKISKILGSGSFSKIVECHNLVRSQWTEPQTGLGRKKRFSNIRGAFSLMEASKVSGKNILLMDDVFTTGATVDECTKVLLNGGAEHVDVLTLARAI